MIQVVRKLLADLGHPIPPEPQQHGMTLTVVMSGSMLVVLVFWQEMPATSWWSLLALVMVLFMWAIYQRRLPAARKTELSMLPLSLFSLAALCVGVAVTGQSDSPIFLLNYVGIVVWATLFRVHIALFVTMAASALLFLPLFFHFDRSYFFQALFAIPIFIGTTYFVGQTLTPLRARAKENRYLATLAASTEIFVRRNIHEILDATAVQVMNTTNADSCILYMAGDQGLLTPKVVRLSKKYYTGHDEALWWQKQITPGEGLTGWVAQHREAVISNDTEQDPRAQHLPGTDKEEASAIMAPMVMGEKLVGVIRASRRGLNQFTYEDLHLMQLLAGQAVIAVERARLYEETRELAMTDPLTSLYNRHYFNRELEPALRQAESEQLAVMMIDLYDFKRVNDTYGHLVGDEVLKLVADLLRGSVRSADIVVRYGGDEFVVIMPGTQLQEAAAVKRRIESSIQHWNGVGRQPDQPAVSLNIGIESAPAADLLSILSQADEGMYAAKRSEDRNRLTAILTESEVAREKHALQSVLALTKIQELKDPYTRGHAERARRLAMRVAERMGLGPEDATTISFGAVLHDVGKIVIPQEILQKAGPLTEDEMRVMRRHPEFGANILGELELLSDVKPLVLYHQERYDGETSGRYPGYPEGLKGDQIPLGSRIIAVVDAYDAMTSDRSYRRSLPHTKAVAELQRHAGTQFDPKIVESFLTVLEEMPRDRSVAASPAEN